MNEKNPENEYRVENTRPSGLTAEEVAEKTANGKSNRSTSSDEKSTGRILADNILTLFNLLNFILAVCLVAVGSYRNILFMGVVFSNILIGTIQEIRARNTIRKLQILNAPAALVLREGKELSVSAEELVEGDLVILKAGDQIAADAVVRFGNGCVNESLLTGESDDVRKNEKDTLLSGSYVTEGHMTAQLIRVGEDSYVNRLTKEARQIRQPVSMLMKDMKRLIRLASQILVPLGILLFLKQYLIVHADLQNAVTRSAASMIGMIPEGLMLLTSVALAVGVVKLGRRKTLVQELYGIETLARIDTLCLDKTGTITTGRMTLERLIPLEGTDGQTAEESLALFLGAQKDGGSTLEALRNAVRPARTEAVAVLPFSSKRKKSAVTLADQRTLILGAPSFVLDDREIPADLRGIVEKLSGEGGRVLLLAEADAAIKDETLPPVRKLLALCVLKDELRANAEETIGYFREQGVTLKVISGDDPRTVSRIAASAGLPDSGRWIDVSTLDTEEKITAAAENHTVFGRVTPAQKKLLVEALRKNGHSVGMTGDGVNDIPALKSADCSVAMAGGSDAARHAAQIILLDSDFSSMPAVVLEGRRVVNNITRGASLFLTKTLFSFLLSLLSLLIPGIVYPFQPIHLTLISSLMIGFPSFVLALEPSSERITGDFLKKVLLRAIPGAVSVTVCATLAMLCAGLFGWAESACATIAVIVSGFACLVVLLNTCSPFNRLRLVLSVGMAICFITAVLCFGDLFCLTGLNVTQVLAAFLLCALAVLIFYGARWMDAKLSGSKR